MTTIPDVCAQVLMDLKAGIVEVRAKQQACHEAMVQLLNEQKQFGEKLVGNGGPGLSPRMVAVEKDVGELKKTLWRGQWAVFGAVIGWVTINIFEWAYNTSIMPR